MEAVIEVPMIVITASDIKDKRLLKRLRSHSKSYLCQYTESHEDKYMTLLAIGGIFQGFYKRKNKKEEFFLIRNYLLCHIDKDLGGVPGPNLENIDRQEIYNTQELIEFYKKWDSMK